MSLPRTPRLLRCRRIAIQSVCTWACGLALSGTCWAGGQHAEPGAERASSATVASAKTSAEELPDVDALMHEVEAHQRENEAASQRYIYRSVETAAENDGKGNTKKSTVRTYDVFWKQGVPVRRMVSKDGKALNPEELRKEDERIDKEVEKARQHREANQAKGRETSPRGEEVVTVSRILELGVFSHERREVWNGRRTIVVDYVGDPKAKTKNRMEEVLRDLVGTVWVDEQDREIVKLEGHFLTDYKVGGGLIASVRKDTSFAMEQRKINSEVWLPFWLDGRGSFRAMLLFHFDGSVRLQNSDFRRFQGSATMLPGVVVVERQTEPQPQ